MNTRIILSDLALCLSLCLAAPLAQAVTCSNNVPASNPDTDYTDNDDGTVTHVPTGLVWKICSEGQTMVGGTCTGTAHSSYTWAQALALASTSNFAGKTDWRLPSIRELNSLVEECRGGPAINDAIFPNTPGSLFLSGSPVAVVGGGSAWGVDFGSGRSDTIPRSQISNRVRLVRGGLPASNPAPVCTLSASPASITTGGSSTLTANCSPAATSFTWTGGTCAGTTSATCSVTPGSTTTYTVTGINTGVTGTAASATVTVNPSACNPTLANTSASAGAAASTGSVSVASTCAWTATSNASWITIASGSSGSGNGIVSYAVAANTGTTVRTGTLTIAGQTFTVTQAGATVVTAPVCTLSANPATITAGSSATLTATCIPVAASYVWTGGGCAGTTGATCSVAPTATTSYTVVGANTGGTGAPASATVTVTTPSTSTLQPNADGTVTDPKTGLVWMRCSMGQTWTGSTCSGSVSTYTFDQANALTSTVTFAGQSDWRMPNIRELQTIVDRSVFSPAIDSNAFPNTPNSNFWPGSPYAEGGDGAWNIDFNDGSALYISSRNANLAVRLVRGGQSFGSLLNLARSTSDYVDHGNGTVTHTPTNLTWMRCAMGQTWIGSTCSGPASDYTFDQAQALAGTTFAGKNDWRMPTVEELLSLVDYSTYKPAINTSIFPSTPGNWSWSSSPYVSAADHAWFVAFGDGYAYRSTRSGSNTVRLVRSGQSSGTVPVCTLSANPASITTGGSSTLTANCSPAASSYTWTGGTCTGTTGASCSVSPTATMSYSVAGTNTVGTGAPASATITVTANTTSYTVPGTLGNDVFVLTAGNYYYGGGGNDTYIISPNTLRSGVTAKIVDSEGDNLIQLADGMTVAASTFYADAAQLTLSNGAKVQILGASRFKFQLGANAPAGDTAAILTYSEFVSSLGASLSGTLPASGTAGYVVSTGFTQASAPVPSVAGSSYTVPGTLDDDVLVPSGGNNYLGGGGNDTYIISPYTLSGAVTAKITDTEGTNVIQLVGGLTIASSSFFSNAVQLTLSNGAKVQVLGASGFSYQLGANAPAGETANSLSYAQFAATLGASVPTGSSAVSGSANFVVSRSGP
ncbi:MAG: DUF1566 domain-containing protein [Rhodoferax sp.]|nr:DUF1566 domain-containing protein [Rhodoferax sp.]